MKITFPSFPIVLPKQPVHMHFRAVLMKNVNYWPYTVFLFISPFMLMYGSSFLSFFTQKCFCTDHKTVHNYQ